MKTWFNDREQSFLFYLFLVLFVILVGVILFDHVEDVVGKGLGLPGQKNAILTFLGLSMGGVLLVMQTIIANTRAEAMEKAALEQAKANENAEKGQRQERLKNAIEHLGHDSVSIRLGGAYELFHLAQDTEDLRRTVLDILCSHIRRTTNEDEYRDKHSSKPSEEIQSLLTLLFVQEHEIFKDCHINLQGSWLNGIDLHRARLEKAVLIKANLHEVNLSEADLREADLKEAYLHEASLVKARLQGASLVKARLQHAKLSEAQLQGANLCEAQLPEAALFQARLQGADLGSAHLQGADLSGTQLQGATLSDAKFHEVYLYGAQLQGVTSQFDSLPSFEARIRDRIGKESDLGGITFAGELTEGCLDSLVEGLPDDSTAILREKLTSHIETQPSNRLPKNSGAICGSYTEEEAEQWIAEYKEAVSEVRDEGNS